MATKSAALSVSLVNCDGKGGLGFLGGARALHHVG